MVDGDSVSSAVAAAVVAAAAVVVFVGFESVSLKWASAMDDVVESDVGGKSYTKHSNSW